MPRKKRADDEDRRGWPRVHIEPEFFEAMTIIATNRRIPLTELHTLIEEAIRTAFPADYADALEKIKRFNDAAKKKPPPK